MNVYWDVDSDVHGDINVSFAMLHKGLCQKSRRGRLLVFRARVRAMSTACGCSDALVDNDYDMPTLPSNMDRRLEMLDGLPAIHTNPFVPRGTRLKISFCKTLIMAAVFAASGATWVHPGGR